MEPTLVVAEAGLWDWSLESGMTYLSPQCYAMTGYDPHEVMVDQEFAKKLLHPDDWPRVWATIEAHMKGETPSSEVEFRMFRRNGEVRWMSGKGQVTARDGAGKPLRMMGVLIDITADKQTRDEVADVSTLKQLEYNARWCEAIVQNSEDAVIGKTLDGIVTSWNPSAQALFGYTPDEMIGRPMLELIPQDRQAEEAKILHKLAQGERINYFDTLRLHKDGHPIDVSLSISPIREPQGKVIGISSIARDITFSKQTEREILWINKRLAQSLTAKSFALLKSETDLAGRTRELMEVLDQQAHAERMRVEQERKRLSQELHDEIGQMLVALNINLELVKRRQVDEASAVSLKNATDITANLMQAVRNIVRELRPPQLDDLGLAAAIRGHLELHGQQSLTTFTLNENLGVNRFDPEVELTCFRVFQESLTNCLRHANASCFVVSLVQSPGTIRLSLTDNGVGFDVRKFLSTPAIDGHFGLRGMRDRIQAIGGTFSVESVPGQGCSIVADMPVVFPES